METTQLIGAILISRYVLLGWWHRESSSAHFFPFEKAYSVDSALNLGSTSRQL